MTARRSPLALAAFAAVTIAALAGCGSDPISGTPAAAAGSSSAAGTASAGATATAAPGDTTAPAADRSGPASGDAGAAPARPGGSAGSGSAGSGSAAPAGSGSAGRGGAGSGPAGSGAGGSGGGTGGGAAPTPAPAIASFSVVSRPTCPVRGTTDAPFSSPGTPVTIAWSVTGAAGAAIAVDNPGLYGAYGASYPAKGSLELPFACNATGTTTHSYTVWPEGAKGTSKTLTVSARSDG